MKKFKFKLVNLNSEIKEYEIETLICKTPLGEISILANHHPLITVVNRGKIRIKNENQEEEIELITDAILEVNFYEVKLICFSY